ncbi:MAG: hydrogenase maturation protease [Euryarchaeota archaeon]|nr:hydrogenase maturation protease [Euryarchaeota archaeon]
MSLRILVLGIGSPIVTDDSIGLRVADQVASLGIEGVDVREASTSGLDLIEVMLDHEEVIIVDAIITSSRPPGTVFLLSEESFTDSVHGTNPHDVNIATAIELGRRLEPERMPKKIHFVAIEVIDTKTISDTMSPEVEKALPRAADAVVDIIRKAKAADS